MWDDLKDRPLLVLLGALGVAICIWALSFVVRAAIAGVGLAISIVAGGVVGAAASSPWVVPAASIGVAATGAFLTYRVVVLVVKQAKSSPFDFATAALSLLSALLVGLVKEHELNDMPITALLLAAATAFAVAVGGALLKSKGLVRKTIGFLFPLLPAGVIVAHVFSAHGSSVTTGLGELTPAGLIALGALLLSSILLAALANS
jgi:hypothetical protein